MTDHCVLDVEHILHHILQVHLKKRGDAVADDVTEESLRKVAFNLDGASGAAIANLINRAGLRAEKDGRNQIRIQDIANVSCDSPIREYFLP